MLFDITDYTNVTAFEEFQFAIKSKLVEWKEANDLNEDFVRSSSVGCGPKTNHKTNDFKLRWIKNQNLQFGIRRISKWHEVDSYIDFVPETRRTLEINEANSFLSCLVSAASAVGVNIPCFVVVEEGKEVIGHFMDYDKNTTVVYHTCTLESEKPPEFLMQSVYPYFLGTSEPPEGQLSAPIIHRKHISSYFLKPSWDFPPAQLMLKYAKNFALGVWIDSLMWLKSFTESNMIQIEDEKLYSISRIEISSISEETIDLVEKSQKSAGKKWEIYSVPNQDKIKILTSGLSNLLRLYEKLNGQVSPSISVPSFKESFGCGTLPGSCLSLFSKRLMEEAFNRSAVQRMWNAFIVDAKWHLRNSVFIADARNCKSGQEYFPLEGNLIEMVCPHVSIFHQKIQIINFNIHHQGGDKSNFLAARQDASSSQKVQLCPYTICCPFDSQTACILKAQLDDPKFSETHFLISSMEKMKRMFPDSPFQDYWEIFIRENDFQTTPHFSSEIYEYLKFGKFKRRPVLQEELRRIWDKIDAKLDRENPYPAEPPFSKLGSMALDWLETRSESEVVMMACECWISTVYWLCEALGIKGTPDSKLKVSNETLEDLRKMESHLHEEMTVLNELKSQEMTRKSLTNRISVSDETAVMLTRNMNCPDMVQCVLSRKSCLKDENFYMLLKVASDSDIVRVSWTCGDNII